jgi:type I restriction enzyme R subunit
MTSVAGYSEDLLIERPTMELFGRLDWRTANCYHETYGPRGTLGRETASEVVLVRQLKASLGKLNPALPLEAINLAIEELVRDRSSMSLTAANREIMKLLKDGVKVTFKTKKDEQVSATVRVIDWNSILDNDFFLASQFWVTGEMYKRRLDLVGFVNGIPLIVIELKAAHKALKDAYDNNLRDYKSTIPHLFWYNGIIILSNGSESRVGSLTSGWEHFVEWKKIDNEGEEGVISLETMIRGTCDPPKLLDLIENFTLFSEEQGLVKRLAKNHQYLGVNNTIESLKDIKKRNGRLGVFWHTQGSGKSYSMIFFSQKVLRKMPGHWTFLIVTDRDDLDGQIYKKYADAGVVTEPQASCQAKDGRHLQRLLQEDHRYIFTLIQKFRTEKGEPYLKLSDRSDIIVIADEAHRTQYDTFALNMRTAIPKAAFIAFTGTPLIVGEEKTRDVFGDYVSVYDFQQSVDDGATVPLYYENRIPEVELEQRARYVLANAVDSAGLTDEEERKLESEFRRDYQVITRNDRLEKIAKDIVNHFVDRGYKGKAMVVSIDKATAVKMYDKVQKHWKAYLERLDAESKRANEHEKAELKKLIKYMRTTDMAVVVSQSQNEIEILRKKHVDIVPHRRRMVKEDLDKKFKDPKDSFRIVFVCAMWMVGFDVPSCSTIYLDKPLRNHTLMQTIARANRVFEEKVNGLIVDYVGVFRNLRKALAIYATYQPGLSPVKSKSELVRSLKEAVEAAKVFCKKSGVDLDALVASTKFQRVRLLDEAVESILVSDETKVRFAEHALVVARLFKAVKPDPVVNDVVGDCAALAAIYAKIRSLSPSPDISGVKGEIEEILDQSVFAKDYVGKPSEIFDLAKIDFAKLNKNFISGHKHIEAERLRAQIVTRLQKMVLLNRSRFNLLDILQKTIDEYNTGSLNVEQFFNQLLELAKTLQDEEKRHIAENLSEEELAMFDLLTKPEMKLTRDQEVQIKKVAEELLQTLKKGQLVLDWRKRQQTRAAVRLCIAQKLDYLPEVFTRDVYEQKCDIVYQHVYESYFGEGKSIYTMGTAT